MPFLIVEKIIAEAEMRRRRKDSFRLGGVADIRGEGEKPPPYTL